MAENNYRAVGRCWSHTDANNAADRPDMNKTLAADSRQVLRRACRVGRKSLAVDSPQLRCRRADMNGTLVEDSFRAVRHR